MGRIDLCSVSNRKEVNVGSTMPKQRVAFDLLPGLTVLANFPGVINSQPLEVTFVINFELVVARVYATVSFC